MNPRDWKTTTVGVGLALAQSVAMSGDAFSPNTVQWAKCVVVLLTALLGWVARDSHPDAHAPKPTSGIANDAPTAS
jgi:hypothetical protein